MKKYLLLSLTLIALCIASCNKYEEGPKFSLASKKARIAGRWTPTQLLQDGVDVTANINRAYAQVRMDKKGGASLLNFSGNAIQNGTWEFESDKENLALTFTGMDGVTYKEVFKILKLKKNELWLEYTIDGHTYEDHWEQ